MHGVRWVETWVRKLYFLARGSCGVLPFSLASAIFVGPTSRLWLLFLILVALIAVEKRSLPLAIQDCHRFQRSALGLLLCNALRSFSIGTPFFFAALFDVPSLGLWSERLSSHSVRSSTEHKTKEIIVMRCCIFNG